MLRGRHVRLEPLAAVHHDALCEAVRDGELWNHWYTAVPTPEGMLQKLRAACTCRPRAACALLQ